MRVSGLDIPTACSISSTRSRLSGPRSLVWSSRVSSTCSPIVRVGSSEVEGSWKTIARLRPRTRCISRSVSLRRSRPR